MLLNHEFNQNHSSAATERIPGLVPIFTNTIDKRMIKWIELFFTVFGATVFCLSVLAMTAAWIFNRHEDYWRDKFQVFEIKQVTNKKQRRNETRR